jgi:hypothetical protein
MIRHILALFSRPHRHVCLSEQRKALLRALAAHAGRPQLHGATDKECAEALTGALRDAENRAWQAEKRADELEQAWRDLLSLQLGAQVPASMPVDPEAVVRQFVLTRRAGGAQG